MTEVAQVLVGEIVVREDNPIADLTATWLDLYRRSPETQHAYRNDLKYFLRWCEYHTNRRGDPAPIDPLRVTTTQLDEYRAWLDGQPGQIEGTLLAPASVNRKLSALSSWFDYLLREGQVPSNLVKAVRRPRVDRESHTTGLTEDELRAVIRGAGMEPPDGGGTRQPSVDLLCQVGVMRFLATIGCRITELTSLDVRDLGEDSGHTVVILRMKGGKMRSRVVPVDVADAIRAHHLDRAHKAGISAEELTGPMFADRQGRRLTRDVATGIVRRAARVGGIKHWRKITPHSFRHAWATLARQKGATLEERQYALGHTDPITTQRYDRAAINLARDPSHLVGAALAPDPVGSHAV